MDVIEDNFRLETLGVTLHALHQFRTLHPIGITRPVVDIGGGRQLAAHLQPGHQNRLEIGAGRINRGGVAGRARSQNQQTTMLRFSHGMSSLRIQYRGVQKSAWPRRKTGQPPIAGWRGKCERIDRIEDAVEFAVIDHGLGAAGLPPSPAESSGLATVPSQRRFRHRD